MFEFLSLREEAFGLEISDTAVRFEQLTKKQNARGRRRVFSASLNKGIVSGGEIKKAAELTEIIKQIIKEKKITAKRAAVSLPEEKTFLAMITMPPMPLENLSQAVIYEAENYIPLALEDVYLDFEIIDGGQSLKNNKDKINNNIKNGKDNFEILLTAAPRILVDSYVNSIKSAGIVPFVLEPESQAIIRTVALDKKLGDSGLVIHIGDSKTILIFYSVNAVRFTYTIPISNLYFNEIIAKNAGVPPERAEYFKTAYGISINSAKSADLKQESILRQKIFESLIPGLIDFVQQVAKCVSYYKTHYASAKQPQKIILCGSGSNLNGLGDFISLKLDLPVIEHSQPNLINNSWKDFAVVHGLALRALSESQAV